MPLGLLRGMGAFLGEAVFWLSPVYRRRIRENMRRAGYNDEALFRRVRRNAGRQPLESFWIWYRPADEVLRRVECPPGVLALVGEAMRSRRPVVFMTPHAGNFEVLPVWLAHSFFRETGRSITVLFKPPHKEVLRKIVDEVRLGEGVEVAPTTVSGIKHIIRNLRNGHTFGVLPDQVPSHGQGIWVDFFGRPAYTMTLPVRVARQFDALRLFVWSIRTKEGWRLEAKLWDEPLTGDPKTDAAAMNRQIEDVIRSCPEQYGWSYNRYKVPRGVPEPP